jgi:hypothetical protein
MELVIVALIGGPLMWVLRRYDKRNTTQHAEGQEAADRRHGETLGAITKIDERLDHHISWHLGAPKNNKKDVA